jgi:hypothetical protein
MTAKQAKEILTAYCALRKGNVPHAIIFKQFPYEPNEITEAIEFAIKSITTMYGEK